MWSVASHFQCLDDFYPFLWLFKGVARQLCFGVDINTDSYHWGKVGFLKNLQLDFDVNLDWNKLDMAVWWRWWLSTSFSPWWYWALQAQFQLASSLRVQFGTEIREGLKKNSGIFHKGGLKIILSNTYFFHFWVGVSNSNELGALSFMNIYVNIVMYYS